MGIGNKCFEILENGKQSFSERSESALGQVMPVEISASDEEDEDEDADDEDLDEVDDEDEEDDTESDDDDADDDTDSEPDEGLADKIVGRLRLREILFYDDKVAIFKARHGRL